MAGLSELAALVEARSGMTIGAEKRYLLEARLAPILRRESLDSLDELNGLIAKGGCTALEREITEALATHETLFFRDGKPFDHLRAALPALVANRPPGARLRLWSAATATGQETYSLAMTMAECGLSTRDQVEIVGSDLARGPIERARNGKYTQYEVQRGLSVHRLVRYFTPDGHEWRIDAGLQAVCQFREWNLLDDPASLGRFDVVFCRNVLFYLNRTARETVLSQIRKQLAPDGLLYLGAAETAAGLDDALERDGPAYRLAGATPATDQAIAPRAATGQRASTLPPLHPTNQS